MGEYPQKRKICLKFRKDALQERIKNLVLMVLTKAEKFEGDNLGTNREG